MAGETDESRGVADRAVAVHTPGVAVARGDVLNERSTAQLPAGPRTVPREVVERLRSAVPKVKLVESLRMNLKDTGPSDDLLFETVRELAAIYGGSADYNALYLDDVAVLERWFWPQALTFLEATIDDMRDVLGRLRAPYRDIGLPAQSLFLDLLSWMGLISGATSAGKAADRAVQAVGVLARDPIRAREDIKEKYAEAVRAQDTHRQALETVRQFEISIHSRHPLFPLIKSYLEDRGRLARYMERPEWSASTLYADDNQSQATVTLVRQALDFARVSIDGLERRVNRREWEDMTAILRVFAAGTFQRDPALTTLCNDFIADRVGLTLIDILGLVGMAIGVVTLIVASAGAGTPLLLALGTLELGAGVADLIATLYSHGEAAELNRLAAWDAAWRVAKPQGDPAISGVMVVISLVTLVPDARKLLVGLRQRTVGAATLEVAEGSVDAATSLRRAPLRDAIPVPEIDEPLRLESKIGTLEPTRPTDVDRGLSFPHKKDVDPGRAPRGLQRREPPSTHLEEAAGETAGAPKKLSKQELEEQAEFKEQILRHREEPVKTHDILIEDFETHNLRRAGFRNPVDQWLDDIRLIVTDPKNPLGLAADEVLALRAIDTRDWAALVGKVSPGELAAFNKGGASRVGAVGKLKGAIQELFIPQLPGFARALDDARTVIRLKKLNIADDAVRFSSKVTDASGQLTDGIVYAVDGDKVYIFSVFEAKSKGNLLDVARTEFGPDEVADFINLGQVENSLRRLETNAITIEGKTFEPANVLLGPDAGFRTRWQIIAPSDTRTAKALNALQQEIAGQGRAVEVVTSPLKNGTYGELARRILILLTGR